ncbi:MAG: hypothetical protein SFW66_10845 [Gammaproteobacteria bacterium]|nr:hypothetical protein [Gammaproteobacteria bacterium]
MSSTRIIKEKFPHENQLKLKVVLDLDGTIIIRDDVDGTEFEKVYKKVFPEYILSDEFYIGLQYYSYTILLLPGALEFISWLNDHPEISLYFFSNVFEAFNISTIQRLK